MTVADATAMRPLVLPALPEVLYVETSNSCNSLCETCPLTFFGNGTPHHLSLEEFERIIDQFPRLKRVVLHGLGEPLLNRQLPAIVRSLKARGVTALFNSNVIALTPRLQEELVRAGLDELRVSLDAATPETYRRVRGVAAFPKVVKHLREMVETRASLRSATPRISVWFTTLRENLAELAGAVRIAAEAGADEFYIQRLVYAGYGLAQAEQSLFGKALDEEREQLRLARAVCAEFGMRLNASGDPTLAAALAERTLGGAPEQAGGPGGRPWLTCWRPWYLSYVTARGDVLACCFVPFVSASVEPAHVLGNIFVQSADIVWNGRAYQEFRRRFQSDDPPECCRNCGMGWSV